MKYIIFAAALALAPACAAAQPGGAPVLAAARFEQIAMTVSDLDAARAFYRDRLGLRLMFEAGEMLFFDVGGTRLMLAHDEARTRSERPSGILYFHVEDFAASLARLQASRATLVGPVETVQEEPAGWLRLQQFEDPDGNMLAIMGFVPR
jgi:catechol 2,3-dioxygenase-like lactoylglutathione lyase family enzyme